jgi:amino acid transporter
MKKSTSNLTPKLRQNWWIDALLGLSALIAILSSLYFLIYPVGGYQGGRNPYYNAILIFDRHTLDILHTWSGLGMILVALIHILIHWDWITGTLNRTWQVILRKRKPFGLRLSYNIVLDVIIAVSFLVCWISSLYFLVYPDGGTASPIMLFNRTTWDLIHTWSGVLMTITAVLHFVLHWKWVTNITGKMFAKRQAIQPELVNRASLETQSLG